MRIIKLNATQSTNDYLRALSLELNCEDYTTVTTNSQTKGKGQMGSYWSSKAGQNLTFSVLKRGLNLDIENKFMLNVITSLALYRTLEPLNFKNLAVKWPNDILADNKKICGVLIENVIKQGKIDSSIIGIGLNVNQLNFENLPKASSMKILTGIHYNLDELLHNFRNHLISYFEFFSKNSAKKLLADYNDVLFRKEKPSTFKTAEGLIHVGIIKRVLNSGELEVLFEDDYTRHFQLKEIQLIY